MNPFIREKKRCPYCNAEISEWNFFGSVLDNAVIDKESGSITFEVKSNCLVCNAEIFSILWLVEINDHSKFSKLEQGL